MKFVVQLGLLVAAWLFPSAAPAQADPEGTWAIRAEGRTLMLIELHRDAAAPGGWTGAWSRPERLTIDQTHLASGVGGPVIRRPILRAAQQGDGLELTVQGRDASAEPDVFTFRVVDQRFARLGWRDWPAMPPLDLERAGPGEAVAADWDSARAYPLTAVGPSLAEMNAIFAADQADRQDGADIDWSAVGPRDEARRARTLALLNAGALHSGEDFYHAAFVFQHGAEANDYLLAHTLAVIAAARGRPDATWIAAATLDRYLQSIGQKQIYGTQFRTYPGQPTTQEPYDRAVVSDALRQALGVPPQADQERQRAGYDAEAARSPDNVRE